MERNSGYLEWISKIFVDLKKSRQYFRKLYIQIVDFCNSYRSQPFPINKFERLDSYEILKFCGEMNWRCLASEQGLNAKTIEFLSSFFRNVVREDQFQLLDLRQLHIKENLAKRPTLISNQEVIFKGISVKNYSLK